MRRQGILAAEFALVGVVVGLAAGILFALPAPSGDKTGNANAGYGQNGPTTPRTGYVDFVKLVKADPQFLTKQWEYMRDLEINMRDEAMKFELQREQALKDLKRLNPDEKEYRETMDRIVKFSAESNRTRLQMESETHRAVDSEAQKSFVRIKSLVAEIAKQKNYEQVLVISSNSAKNLSFEKLQQQLLLSPVLIYPEQDDITAQVEKELLRRAHGYLEIGDPTAKEGTIENDGIWLEPEKDKKTARIAKDTGKNADDVWFEVKLGAKLQLKAMVTDLGENDKRVPVSGDKAEVEWSLPKLKSGNIGLKTGEYTAPDAMPDTGAVIPVRVCPKLATYRFKSFRIRLLPK